MHIQVDLHTSSHRGVTCCRRPGTCHIPIVGIERKRERERNGYERWGAKEISTCTKCCFICIRTTTLLPSSALLLGLRRQTVRAHKHPYSQLRFARGTHAIPQTYVGEAETRSVSVTKGSYFRSHNSVKMSEHSL